MCGSAAHRRASRILRQLRPADQLAQSGKEMVRVNRLVGWILRAAVRPDFLANILFWGNLDAGTTLIERHPDTRFVIDHMAIQQPSAPPAPPEPWADLPKVLELAKPKNAVIKVSGACTLSEQPYPFPDIWDPLAHLFDAWGFERRLWGTDSEAYGWSPEKS
jgi:predicted TIM-barrel fold metal-dependent hydrolase